MGNVDVGFPVLDNHMHCDPRNGEGIDAVRKFSRSGGTHLCMVNKPSWTLGVEPDSGDDYERVFDETLETADEARSVLEGDVFPVLGVHPAVVSRLVERFDVERAEEIMKGGLETAAEYVEDGDAVALKSGRPHYDVDDEVWEASNRVIRHAFEIASDVDCAVQLHTEEATEFPRIAEAARDTGLGTESVVKHYSSPGVEEVTRSVMSREEWLVEASEDGREFMMETDYIDDPERPGAVMGTRTVPRRVRTLVEKGYRDEMYAANVETPEEVYGVSIEV
ncbi:MAG: TatD family hydrolase [Halobacteria archaeon]|nr:TatD family hydrolase [Halobacteria archaeon]